MALVVGIEIGDDGARPLLTPARVGEVARRAEAAGFGFLTLDDATPGPGIAGRLDPVTVAAFASATTSTIGLVPVVHTAHAEPFHVSNQLSSLDHGSRGRAGWIVGTEATAARAGAYGEAHVTDPRLLAVEASEVVDAARRLWDSWQDDAIIADEATGRFLDADRMHYVEFHGELFSVKGPALVPRPPQGQVVVFASAGALRQGLADVALVRGWSEPELRSAAGSAERVVAEIEIRHAGSAADLVALLTGLDGVVDGVRLIPADLDADLAVLQDEVLPALRDAVVPAAPAATLRERFGLARPTSRYATSGRESS